jgi:curved DNA-binding protein CbpA
MRLGKDVLEADLYGALGLLPDATASEIRVAYRRQARASHPDLNQEDPDALRRMMRLNIAARVLLDPALRGAYDQRQRRANATRQAEPPPQAEPSAHAAWFEQSEQSADNDWAAPPPAVVHAQRARFSGFFQQLRGRDGHLSLQLQELVESLSGRQQIGIAAILLAVAMCLIAMARPQSLVGDSVQPTSVRVDSVYP